LAQACEAETLELECQEVRACTEQSLRSLPQSCVTHALEVAVQG